MGEAGDYELESRKTCLLIFIQGSKSNASLPSQISYLNYYQNRKLFSLTRFLNIQLSQMSLDR